MADPWQSLIERIHAAPQQAVIVVTGGGASAISALLSIPGGSRTLLEAIVPYSDAALTDWLGRSPEHFCVEETALAMAAVAYRRAGRLGRTVDAEKPHVPAHDHRMGVACTASLVSDRPKKGDHRAHVATQTGSETRTWSLVLSRGTRNRIGEERLVGQLILYALARTAGLEGLPSPDLLTGEAIVEHHAAADSLLVDLLAGKRSGVWSLPLPAAVANSELHDASGAGVISKAEQIRGLTPPARRGESEIHALANCTLSANLATVPPPMGLLCGSFNPLHFGHEQLRVAAERQLGGPIYYEMSICNVDKPPLDFLSIERRRAQFGGLPLALTAAPTFAEKAAALPGVTFVMGVDTAQRIVEPRYYGGSAAALREALLRIRNAGCHFLVAGRKANERFETLADVSVPVEFAGLFAKISPEEFRADVSATEIRRMQA
jgi:hypothetical protein